MAFAKREAIVAPNNFSPLNVETVVDKINKQGKRAKAYIEDVAKQVGPQHLIIQVKDDFGRTDILINHAPVEPQGSVLDINGWDRHRVLDANLTRAFLMIQSAGHLMWCQGSGVIINLIAAADKKGLK